MRITDEELGTKLEYYFQLFDAGPAPDVTTVVVERVSGVRRRRFSVARMSAAASAVVVATLIAVAGVETRLQPAKQVHTPVPSLTLSASPSPTPTSSSTPTPGP